MTLDSPPPKMKWPRSQRFMLTERGREAESAYRERIVASRSVEGRASFDAARAEWAESLGVRADDGLYLAEMAARPMMLAELITALETCGKNRQDAIAAIERLLHAGLLLTGAAT